MTHKATKITGSYLSTPEKDKRLQRLHQQHRMDRKKLARLQATLERAIEQRGVTVDEGLHQDLQGIIKENEKSVCDAHPPGSFSRLFWDNQVRASAASDARSMKWDPLMIRWCLYLRHLSGSAYEMLRESGVVKLPSQRTLRDYTYMYIAKAAAGFSREIDVHLMEAANLLSCPEREKHIVLLMDEMHLREDLVYDLHTGRYNYVHVQYIHIHVYTCTCTCTCTYKDFHTGLYNMYSTRMCIHMYLHVFMHAHNDHNALHSSST